MNKKTLMIVGGVIVVLVIAGAASRYLGKSAAEQAIEDATGGDVDVNGNDVTVKTDEGTWSTSDKLPADFPSDVPVYSGAKVVSSVASNQEQGAGIFVGLETSDNLDVVIAWYKEHVTEQGWKIVSDAMIQGNLILGATKDTRDFSVTVSSEDGKTVIALVVVNQ